MVTVKTATKSLDHSVLPNVNALEDEFETLWIEINTGTKSKTLFAMPVDILMQMLVSL